MCIRMTDAELDIALEGVTLAGVELEQAIYAGGKIRNAIQLAEIGSDIAVLDVERNTAEVITLARLQLEDASTRLTLTEQALTQAEENLATSRDR